MHIYVPSLLQMAEEPILTRYQGCQNQCYFYSIPNSLLELKITSRELAPGQLLCKPLKATADLQNVLHYMYVA